MNFYGIKEEPEMTRGLERLIADTVYELLKSYNLTLDDCIRLVIQQLALGATRAVIEKIEEYYKRYKKRG